MSIEQVLQQVPDYLVFKTVDELKAGSRKLVEQYPEIVELLVPGKSRNGEDIEVLKIGKGSNNVLLFACPHPNEPIGAMMLDFLAEKLVTDDDFRNQYDLTWYIIKCVDPDGTRLNEGWFKGPFTPANYARNFFRPASYEQVEWTFPIEYKTLKFNNPLPETQALMKIIEEIKPSFLYSLHNAGFGGAYYYISKDRPELYETFRSLVTDRQLPLHLGEPEVPYAKKFGDAIYELISSEDSYDYYAENTDLDPAEIISGGAASFEYLKRFRKDALCLVCEMPYFYDPKIEDVSQSNISRKEAILESVKISNEVFGFITGILREADGLLTHESPFIKAVKIFLSYDEKGSEAKIRWAEANKEFEEPATVAQLFDNVTIVRFYKMLTLGMTIRHLEYEIEMRKAEGGSGVEKLVELKERTEEYFNEWNQKLEAELNYQVIPIKKLVQVQLGSALEVVKEYIK